MQEDQQNVRVTCVPALHHDTPRESSNNSPMHESLQIASSLSLFSCIPFHHAQHSISLSLSHLRCSLPSSYNPPSPPNSKSALTMVGASTIHILLSFSLLISALALAHCLQDKQTIPLHHLQWGHRSPNSQAASSHTSSRQNSAGTVLEILKHQIHSEDDDDHQKLLLSDSSRVSSMQSHIKARIPLVSGIQLRTLNYVVNIGVGGRKMTVIVDTGSDLTWIQCKPCVSCYNQQDPLFDPSSSPSYHSIPCASPTCTSLRSATGAPGTCGLDRSPNCYYGLSYGDGSYTRGVLATETLNLGGAAVQGFVFGCGRSNRGLFGGTSGIMGLGRSQLSLISQTSPLFNGVFSYCLPSHIFNSSGSLVLGDDPSLYSNTTPVSYTRMISDPIRAPFYFLNLTGVTVGGVAIQASARNMLIDSGTVITRLAPSIYKALKAEFVKQFADYPPAPSFSILDTCFDLSKYEEVKVPSLKLGFDGGVGVNVDVSGIFYFVKRDASQVCMAVTSLSSEDEVGIIGNYQQRNLRVVYDTVGSRLGFAEEACGFS